MLLWHLSEALLSLTLKVKFVPAGTALTLLFVSDIQLQVCSLHRDDTSKLVSWLILQSFTSASSFYNKLIQRIKFRVKENTFLIKFTFYDLLRTWHHLLLPSYVCVCLVRVARYHPTCRCEKASMPSSSWDVAVFRWGLCVLILSFSIVDLGSLQSFCQNTKCQIAALKRAPSRGTSWYPRKEKHLVLGLITSAPRLHSFDLSQASSTEPDWKLRGQH